MMEKTMIMFLLKIKSTNPDLDNLWNADDFYLETSFILNVGDTLNLNLMKSQDNLIRDFKTAMFIVVEREYLYDPNFGASEMGIMNLYIKPIEVNEKKKRNSDENLR